MTARALPAVVAAHAAVAPIVLGALAAALLAWASVAVSRARACELRESIAQRWCSPVAPGSGAQVAELRRRIERNPGDVKAYTELALADRSAAKPRLVEVASRLAPREPNLLLHRAAAALDARDWNAAVGPLVELAENHDDPLAASSLAWLVQAGHGSLLQGHLKPGTRWLERMVTALRNANGSISAAVPLILRARKDGVIDGQTLRAYMRDLKQAREWGDAYALWLLLNGGTASLLFNGSFERAFEAGGFDWEVAPKSVRPAVAVERRREDDRGPVLELQFKGRAIELPMLRQDLFIGPGRYRLRGDYKARQFASGQGVVWALRCSSGGGHRVSEPLQDTAGTWQSFEFEFAIPPDCGLLASLQLETGPAEPAAGGLRGKLVLDALTLERTRP